MGVVNLDTKIGETREIPVHGQDRPKIYEIRHHTPEVTMHRSVLELHAVRVIHAPHGDERQLHSCFELAQNTSLT